MYPTKSSYPAPERREAGNSQTAGWYRLPPDVEPLPQTESAALRLWLHSRHMPACDRGAASKGLMIGHAMGELLLRVRRALLDRTTASDLPRRTGGAHASFPRLRRVPFYRRARALQFKKYSVR